MRNFRAPKKLSKASKELQQWANKHNIKHRSIFEIIVQKRLLEEFSLDLQEVYEVERLEYIIPKQTKFYTPDIKLPNGIYIDLKGGTFESKDRTKTKHFIKSNPDVDLRFVFKCNSRINPKNRNSKTYGEWCESQKLLWAVGKIPESWIKEEKKC